MLWVENLTGGYGPVQVVQGLSFEVAAGEVVVILGANGSGKTTTLRTISGMIHGRGTVTFDGTSLLGKRPDQIVRMGIAHVPQGRGTITDLTVEENLRLGAYVRADREVEEDIEQWCAVFPRLGERRDQPAGSMSGGEQQMLAIARALMSKPKLLLLDEPSLGLAPLVTREVFEKLESINRETGAAVLVVEQNAGLALGISSRGYVLETGQIVAQGSSEELSTDEAVRQAYLGY